MPVTLGQLYARAYGIPRLMRELHDAIKCEHDYRQRGVYTLERENGRVARMYWSPYEPNMAYERSHTEQPNE